MVNHWLAIQEHCEECHDEFYARIRVLPGQWTKNFEKLLNKFLKDLPFVGSHK